MLCSIPFFLSLTEIPRRRTEMTQKEESVGRREIKVFVCFFVFILVILIEERVPGTGESNKMLYPSYWLWVYFVKLLDLQYSYQIDFDLLLL